MDLVTQEEESVGEDWDMEPESAYCHHCQMQQELRKGLSEDSPLASSEREQD